MTKGQYMAIESMLTFAMGLVLALGTITIFTTYRSNAMDNIERRQLVVTESRIAEAVKNLQQADRGVKTLKLPEEIGGEEYTVSFQRGLRVITATDERHSLQHLSRKYSFSGTSHGGEIKIIKNQNNFTLGPA